MFKEPLSWGLFKTINTSTTPIVDKIRKLEKLIINGKVTLVDDDGKPLTNVNYPVDHDSEDEVKSVDNDLARSMASERGMSSYARAMLELRAYMELKDTIVAFGHIKEEWPKNLGLGMGKNLKKLSQAPRGVLVGPKVGFKPAKEYRPISKKPTTNTSSNKKKVVEPIKKVSNSKSFDVLNLMKNDKELGTNGGGGL
nr:hypothetical protein [Tanacetum cinerariifolium]